MYCMPAVCHHHHHHHYHQEAWYLVGPTYLHFPNFFIVLSFPWKRNEYGVPKRHPIQTETRLWDPVQMIDLRWPTPIRIEITKRRRVGLFGVICQLVMGLGLTLPHLKSNRTTWLWTGRSRSFIQFLLTHATLNVDCYSIKISASSIKRKKEK